MQLKSCTDSDKAAAVRTMKGAPRTPRKNEEGTGVAYMIFYAMHVLCALQRGRTSTACTCLPGPSKPPLRRPLEPARLNSRDARSCANASKLGTACLAISACNQTSMLIAKDMRIAQTYIYKRLTTHRALIHVRTIGRAAGRRGSLGKTRIHLVILAPRGVGGSCSAHPQAGPGRLRAAGFVRAPPPLVMQRLLKSASRWP